MWSVNDLIVSGRPLAQSMTESYNNAFSSLFAKNVKPSIYKVLNKLDGECIKIKQKFIEYTSGKFLIIDRT